MQAGQRNALVNEEHGEQRTAVNARPDAAGDRGERAAIADLVRKMSYEVMPFRGIDAEVAEHVPLDIPLNVTVTEAKGVDRTLEVAESLSRRGYRVAPHLPARQFVDEHHVAEVVARLREAAITSIFVVGGDVPTPAGKFTDAFSFLQAIEKTGHVFRDVGIPGYPEGHGFVPQQAIELAMKQKAPMATRFITQMCFDVDATARWADGVHASGIDLPILVGVPGPVNRQKLVRISAGIGLGQSARFLQKQKGMLWRFLLPGGFNPNRLVNRLGETTPDRGANIVGLHIFAFNEFRATERWRQELLAATAGDSASER